MKKIISIVFLFAIVSIVSVLNFSKDSKEVNAGSEEIVLSKINSQELVNISDVKVVPEGNNAFGFKLMTELINKDDSKNIIISPFSISTAFAMTQNGAKGETKKEILKVLGLEGFSDETIENEYSSIINYFNGLKSTNLKVADSIWIQKGLDIKQPFLEASKKFFNAEVANVDFKDQGTTDIINDWIDKKTEGQIKKGVDSLDEDNKVVLVNTLYFKGKWVDEFSAEATGPTDFTLSSGEKISVPTMRKACNVSHLKGDNFEAIKLPYYDGIEMDLFMPSEGVNINDFMKSMTKVNFDKWLTAFTDKEVIMEIPKFKLDYSEDEIVDILKELGIKQAFHPKKASFLGISEVPLYVSKVTHRTAVAVEEKETTASATTVIEMEFAGLPSKNIVQFLLNKPFAFAIRDTKTGVILFTGKIENPLGK